MAAQPHRDDTGRAGHPSYDVWSPTRYNQFETERAQPFHDLLPLIERHPFMRVVDLGCGGGALTHELHHRLRAADTLGIDNAASMLADSAQHAGDGVRFEQSDITDFRALEKFDLVFSNAALHWIGDHRRLFQRLRNALRPGGQLAIQLPANQDYATHIAAEETAREKPFAEFLGGATHPRAVLRPAEYAFLLHQLEFEHQTVRLEVYGHLLESREALVDWVQGSLLTWYEARLGEERFQQFLVRYRERLFSKVPHEVPFFLPYQRILIHAELAG